jgi:hypothetical protein
MDRFAKMVVVLELSLFRQVGLFFKFLTDWIMIVLTTKPNMRLFYLNWILHDMGVKHVEAYGDSLLVVQQVSKVCQFLNVFLNAYLNKCLDIISCMDKFVTYHVPREENPRANALALQASGYNVRKRNFQEHNLLLTAECFALKAPVRLTQSTANR